jgi:hypothetical protein
MMLLNLTINQPVLSVFQKATVKNWLWELSKGSYEEYVYVWWMTQIVGELEYTTSRIKYSNI